MREFRCFRQTPRIYNRQNVLPFINIVLLRVNEIIVQYFQYFRVRHRRFRTSVIF